MQSMTKENPMKNRICMIRAMAAALVAAGVVGPVAAGGDYTFSTLAVFNYANGASPQSPLLLDAAGNLYGTTRQGGPNAVTGYGTVFKIDATTGDLTTLARFNTGAAMYPGGPLAMDSAGNLYGATTGGGKGNGTVFKIDPTTGALTTLVEFSGSIGNAPGASPRGGVVLDTAGNLYGTTSSSGPGLSEYGTVFKIDAATGELTTLHAFGLGDQGRQPYAAVTLDSDGDIYGTTYGGWSASGTVFKIDGDSGAISYPALFNRANGATPQGAVTLDALGNIYGTTTWGGEFNGGTVFKIDAVTGLLTTLVSFDRANNGWTPYAGVTLDAAGNIYGTTLGGGLYDFGTVFKIDAATGLLTTLFSFDRKDGLSPMTEVTLDAYGNIYGTTSGGGPGNYGTVFRLSPTSAAVPEPASLAMLGLGCAAIGAVARRRS